MAIRKRIAEDASPERRDNVIDAPMSPRRLTVSEILRGRRVECGFDIDHVAEVLRIRPAILTAIEEGRFETLPGPAYAVGFIRSYAAYLGLDTEALVARFKAESDGAARRPHLQFPLPVSDSRVPTVPLLLICLLLAALIYGGWYYFIAHPGSLTEMIGPVPERLRHIAISEPAPAAQSAPIPTSAGATAGPTEGVEAQPTPATPSAGPTPTSAPASASPQQQAAQAAASPAAVAQPASRTPVVDGAPPVESRSTGATVASLPASPDLTQPAAVGVDAAKSSAASYGAPAGEARIVLKADSDSWIQVRDKSGSLLFTRVLKPGESYNVPNQPGLVLTAGNSGGLEVTVDGASAPPLGQPGKVARNVSLDPDRLLAADHLPAKTEHAN